MNTRKIQKIRALKQMGIREDIARWLGPHRRWRYNATISLGGRQMGI